MKKLLAALLTLMLLLSAVTASAISVPRSTSALPDRVRAAHAPEIIRVQKGDGLLTLTLDIALPEDARVTAYGLDDEYHTLPFAAQADAGNTYTAEAPAGIQWTGFEIEWLANGGKARARYNGAGGLETVSAFDAANNEYRYDMDGFFVEYEDARTGVQVRYNDRGSLIRYGYEVEANTTVWFNPEGDVVFAEYRDDIFAAKWEPEKGWFVSTPNGRVSAKLNVHSPWNATPLYVKEKEEGAEEEKPVEKVWYPKNTVVVCGLTLQEATPSLPEKWYNVLPIDLRQEGRQTYSLMISNTSYVGHCYVDVWGDEVTVSYALFDNTAIEPLSSYGRWFTSLHQITEDSIESTENGFVFGEPVSISQDLDGADVALLFIRNKATYYQPFRDGTNLTRHWRNMTEWKEFRKGLQELMPLVEK